MTLVILAAGMGSRYGGLKQIDPMTDNGEFILDFSIYDAIRAGFDKVVFVIKEENYDLFRETVSKRLEGKIKVEYCFQRIDDIPEGVSIPDGRVKPFGTAHAVLAARDAIDGDFAVINADDFYGRQAFELLAKHFANKDGLAKGEEDCCMVGYRLGNTLTENGTVSRGICTADENSLLVSVTERTKIARDGDNAKYIDADGTEHALSADSIASMNCWGFTNGMLKYMWQGFEDFLRSLDFNDPDWIKKEYYLPYAVAGALEAGKCTVKVYPTSAVWYGVTYHEDREKVRSSIDRLIENKEYPRNMWKK